MAMRFDLSSCRALAVAFALLVPLETRSQSEPQLTASEEKDSYEIYSILLKTELPPQWKITAWAITQETQSFPAYGASQDYSVEACLRISPEQESIYRPLFADYRVKNQKANILKRKFDLPEYALLTPGDVKAIQHRQRPVVRSSVEEHDHLVFPFNATVIFHVSAVGFNQDRSRALVYAGHDCGSLCGGGRYHLMVKKDGQWQEDREFRGMSCAWMS